jgi:hypothetical protein
MTAALSFEGNAWQVDPPASNRVVVHVVVAANEFCRLLESKVALPSGISFTNY